MEIENRDKVVGLLSQGSMTYSLPSTNYVVKYCLSPRRWRLSVGLQTRPPDSSVNLIEILRLTPSTSSINIILPILTAVVVNGPIY